MSSHARILIIEDEPDIARVLSDLLRSEGYQVTTALTAAAGLAHIQQNPTDLLLLDLMLPGMGGMEACQRLRAQGFPGGILMLTARGQLSDQVKGLGIGADDYLVKPYRPEELLARMAALLRRVQRNSGPITPCLTFSGITADVNKHQFIKDGCPLQLSAKEVALLAYLISHQGTTISRHTLLAEIWPEQPAITPRTVDVHIVWLRKKVEPNPDVPQHILTERGIGYRFVIS